MKFTEFSLHGDLQKGIENAGYETCTPVQEQVLKAALEGADLYVQSQTGTGKTAAYLVSLIQEMLSRQEAEGKTALVMVPTRELAVQVEQEAVKLCSGTALKTGSFYGGVGYTRQAELLKNRVDIIIGTPGRVIDLQESKTMDLSTVGFLVIDEADRMFDMGFYPDLRKLIKALPGTKDRQTMLFSATLNTYVKNLAWEYTEEAKEITVESEQITVEEIGQMLLHVASDSKMKLLTGIIANENPDSLIIFCNTKRSCEIVAKRLRMNGVETEFIIGDLPQSKRLQVLDSFKKRALRCLVATDVAARGIDVNDLEMVINYDLPNEPENYVHRIGRTARAGKTGKAYTFCSEQDVYNLPAIERYIEMRIPSSMAGEEQFGEDKSAGVYIRLDSYGEDPHSHRQGDRKGGGNGALSGGAAGRAPRQRGRKDAARSKAAGERSFAAKNTGEDFDALASLPFEERMKLYRQKFAGGEAAESSRRADRTGKDAPSAGFGTGKKKGDGKRQPARDMAEKRKTPGQNRKRPAGQAENRNRRKRAQPAPVSPVRPVAETQKQPRPAEKKGLLARLKSLFGGR